MTETAGDVHERIRAAGWDTCLVLNDERVVLGRVRASALAADPTVPVEQIMEAGPSTIRPDARLAEELAKLRDRGVRSMVVTTPDGRLVGLLRRDDAE